MDNWNVIAAQTSSSAIGRDDINIQSKEKLVSKNYSKLFVFFLVFFLCFSSSQFHCVQYSKQNKYKIVLNLIFLNNFKIFEQ